MKKLFFSAVALVAFSSISMANTIAIEEDYSFSKVEPGDCGNIYSSVWLYAMNHGSTEQQAVAIARAARDYCMTTIGATKKSLTTN